MSRFTLFERHPLAGAPKEIRSHYLSLIALGLVMTEPVTGAQCLALHQLAASLGLDESEANAYCDGKRTIQKENHLQYFQELGYQNSNWIYRLDLAWIQTLDGMPSLKAQRNLLRICHELDGECTALSNLHHLALLIRAQDKPAIIKEMERMFLLAPIPWHVEATAQAAGMQLLKIHATLPEENREQTLSIEWLHRLGQSLQAGETVAALVKAEPHFQTEAVEPLHNGGEPASDAQNNHLLPVQAPSMGIMYLVEAYNGALVQHGMSVGIFYGYPQEA